MRRLRERIRIVDRDDSGFTIIEVLVAMFVFAVISTGLMYTMLSTVQLTRDSRARNVASNLAAQWIDEASEYDGTGSALQSLDNATQDYDINGDTFTVARTTAMVNVDGNSTACGAGTTPLQYKQVTVSVTWKSMRVGTQPVVSNTILTPDSRINDPLRGTVLVRVTNAAGTGVAGVAVTLTPGSPANGATTYVGTIAQTDSQGCTYAYMVNPGNYTVSISKSGYVSNRQVATPTETVSVIASQTSSVQYSYDLAANYTIKYASNVPDSTTLVFPSNLVTSLSVSGSVSSTASVPGSDRKATLKLYPATGGYSLFAGAYSTSCTTADPAAWTAKSGSTYSPSVATVGAAPGGSATANVPMGTAVINGNVLSGLASTLLSGYNYVVATPVNNATNGQPACTDTTKLVFPAVSNMFASGSSTTLALPYGSWQLTVSKYADGSATALAPLRNLLTLSTGAVSVGGVAQPASVTSVTMDPRP